MDRYGWDAVYGYTIEYTEPYGATGSISVNICKTKEEAQSECIRSALKGGWTYPRWWQWWRWGDTRPPFDLVEKIKAELGDD